MTEMQTTRALLERASGGDERARDMLFERSLPPLRRWARGRLPLWARDLLETDDLVQEAVTRSLRGIDHFEPERTGAFLAYLRESVRNRIKDEIKRVRRRPLLEGIDESQEGDDTSPLEAAMGRELHERFEQALASLPDEDRALVIARVEWQQSYAEVAESCGKPSADAARMAVGRALLKLARAMAR